MKKIIVFKSKEKIKNLQSELDCVKDSIKGLAKDINKLNAKLHKSSYPNGLIDRRWSGYSNYLYVGIEYSYNDAIKTARLYTSNEDIKYYAYKTVCINDKLYVSFKYDSFPTRYFIVDMRDNKEIECTDNNALDNIDWTEFE